MQAKKEMVTSNLPHCRVKIPIVSERHLLNLVAFENLLKEIVFH